MYFSCVQYDRNSYRFGKIWLELPCCTIATLKSSIVAYLAIFHQHYYLEHTEYMVGQQRSGLCCRSGSRNFFGHSLNFFAETFHVCNPLKPTQNSDQIQF